MRATSILLYSRTLRDDDGSPAFCGSWHVPCYGNDPRREQLDAVGAGWFRDAGGVPCRAFFFADEIEGMRARAERETGCTAVIDGTWPLVSERVTISDADALELGATALRIRARHHASQGDIRTATLQREAAERLDAMREGEALPL